LRTSTSSLCIRAARWPSWSVQELELQVQYHQSDFDNRLVEEKAMAREMTAKLAREVGKYEKELADLDVFIARKNDLEGKLEEIKTELLHERKKHEPIISELERKTVQEKVRLRKEMEAKIKEAQDAFIKLTDNHLEATTKKTKQENEQMGSELAFQNRQTSTGRLFTAYIPRQNQEMCMRHTHTH
jgi:hypothetical protein